MTDRANMDRPAIAIAATIGVVLILVSALLFMFGPEGEPAGGAETFGVSWTQATADDAEGPIGTAVSTIEVTVADGAPSNITASIEDCTNNNGVPARGNPTITWELADDDGNVIDGGTAPCQAAELGTWELDAHPDVGSAEDQADVWDTNQNRTVTYTLSVSYARAATQTDPLPQAQPATFSATARLEVQQWQADLEEGEE